MHFFARLWVLNWMIFPILDTPTLPAYTVAQIREREGDRQRQTVDRQSVTEIDREIAHIRYIN